jgi:hypothetical protein
MDANFTNFNLNMELTLEQQFQMRLFQESIESMNPEPSKISVIKNF